MIRAANHSSYPRVGDHPLDQQIRRALRARARGAGSPEDVETAYDEVATMVVADQSRAFIDVVTDGMVRWSGPYAHLADHLTGLEKRGLRPWFGMNFYDRQVVVRGEIKRDHSFLVRDLELARSVTRVSPIKIALPGPVSFARMARDEHYGDLDALTDALAAVLAEEVAALRDSGMTHLQIDEPTLCSRPEDLDRVARAASRIFDAAGKGATTILGTFFGDLSGVADSLDRLPGTHLGLDLVAGPRNLELLAKVPDGRGLVLGLFDARTTKQEDAADVAARLEPYRALLTCRDVLVGPNAGLETLPRDQAFDKLLHARYLVEKLSEEWTWDS